VSNVCGYGQELTLEESTFICTHKHYTILKRLATDIQ
jgi:hypothetical protein